MSVYNANTLLTIKQSQFFCNLAQSNLISFQSDSQIKDFLSKFCLFIAHLAIKKDY